MIKQILKLGLLAAMGLTLAFPAAAAEVETGITGSATAKTASYTQKENSESITYLDSDAEAALTIEGTVVEGAWTGSGTAEFSYGEEGFVPENRWVTLENETLSFSLGYWLPDVADISLGKDYLDAIDESFEIGNAAYEGAGESFVKIGVKQIGLELTAGVNRIGDEDATGDSGLYSATLLSAFIEQEIGDLSLSARITSVAEAIDEKQNANGKDSIHDGATKSETAIGIGYRLNNLFFAIHAGQYVQKEGGNPSPDEQTTTTVALVLDVALNDHSGITVSYGSSSLDDGSDNPELTSVLDVGYLVTISGVDLSVGYSSTLGVDEDDDIEDTLTIAGVGMTFNF